MHGFFETWCSLDFITIKTSQCFSVKGLLYIVWYCQELSCLCVAHYNLQAILETLEFKLKNGWKPARTLYIAFGHDEEVV